MAKKKNLENPFARTEPEHLSEQPIEERKKSRGVALPESAWSRIDALANEMGVTPHKIAAWGLLYFIRQLDNGEIEMLSRPTLPDL